MAENNTRPLAIVMGRNYTSRLSMIRSAGMAGCDVVDIQTSKGKQVLNKIDASSRFVSECHQVKEGDQDALIKTIRRYEGRTGAVVLLPTDDYTASTIDAHRAELEGKFHFPFVREGYGCVLDIMDKDHQKELALKAGFNVAKGWVCEYNGGYTIPEDMEYPCFTKPQKSYKSALKKYMKRCNSEQELRSHLASIAEVYNDSILIEQFVTIEKEYAVLGLSLEDDSIIPAVIQMEDDHLGVTATGTISPISSLPGFLEKLKAFMAQTGFVGLFDIDLYESGGKLYFNELNARFGASGFAVTYASQNLPGLFIDHCLGKDSDSEIKDFRTLRFASEKVCAQKKRAGDYDRKRYAEALSTADFTFLKQDDDMGPYEEFRKEMRVESLVTLFDSIRKKLHL